MIAVFRFVGQTGRTAVSGGKLYRAWLAILALLVAFGSVSYVHHLTDGLVVTNMTDQVSWGIGIANFVYFVGVAAAAVILVVPAYVLHREHIKQVVLIGEQMAVIAVVMCLLFIFTDIGRPERFWHLIPGPGMGDLNLPGSLLAWDVIVFNGYLALNMFVIAYVVWTTYSGRTPKPWIYYPPVLISMAWAISIHTVTAFLLSGLGSRPFWNTAILAPRFLISAGASGPALLFMIFIVVRKKTKLTIDESVFNYLRSVLRIAMPVNLFLLGCEVFLEFYTGTLHSVSAKYLYFGLHGYNMLPKFIWPAIALNIAATVIFVSSLGNKKQIMAIGCLMALVGVWTEKGIGLILPGFTPSPLGEIAEYAPNAGEIVVSVGVLALGALLFTLLTKVSIAVQTGDLKMHKYGAPWLEHSAMYKDARRRAHREATTTRATASKRI